MASDQERIEILERLVGNLYLHVHTCCPFPHWNNQLDGLDAIREWILASKDPKTTKHVLDTHAKRVGGKF